MTVKSLEDVQALLKDHPSSAEVLEFVNGLVSKNAEHDKEIGTLLGKARRANSEAQTAKLLKKKIEELGYEGEDPEEFGSWLEGRAKDSKASPDTNQEIEKLRKEFQKAQKALEEEKANASKIKQTADRRAIKAKLLETLRDKVYGPDLLADTLISAGQVRLAEDETVVFISGEEELDFDKGVKKLLESRPDLLKNTQAPGARSGSRPQAVKPTYTLDQLRSMTPEQIAADMDNVKASMRANKS